jgi:2-haloacid dehalogenase
MATYPVYVFDAYGTLFDVHSAVARHSDVIGTMATPLSETWRLKQLEYTWTRTLMGAYRDFRELTALALDFAAARHKVALAPEVRAKLLLAYETLDAFPDVKPTLTALKASGARTAILSNGTPEMLANAIGSAGIGDLLDAYLSIDELHAFKTAPEAYALVEKHMGCAPGDVSFQSSNRWDVAGAVKSGFRGVWINRTNQPDEYADLPPAMVLASLDGLLTEGT